MSKYCSMYDVYNHSSINNAILYPARLNLITYLVTVKTYVVPYFIIYREYAVLSNRHTLSKTLLATIETRHIFKRWNISIIRRKMYRHQKFCCSHIFIIYSSKYWYLCCSNSHKTTKTPNCFPYEIQIICSDQC